MAKDSNFDTMHPFMIKRVHFCLEKAIAFLLITLHILSYFVITHNIYLMTPSRSLTLITSDHVFHFHDTSPF